MDGGVASRHRPARVEHNPPSLFPMNPPRMHLSVSFFARARRGFTLIELLTVIAIIGILAAIIIPTVGKVRESARSAQCASNVRQIAMAILPYANDNRNFAPKGAAGTHGSFTQTNTWNIEIMPYIAQGVSGDAATALQQRKAQEVLRCPTFIAERNPTEAQLEQGFFGIGLNLALGVPENEGGVDRNAEWARIRLTRFSTPSRIVLIGDSNWATSDGARYQMLSSSYQNPDTVRNNGGLRHGSRANYGFADGHVPGMTPEEATAV